MAMFDQLFTQPWVVAHHTNAPFVDERTRYLVYCTQRGDTHATLLLKARELLWIARKLEKFPELDISMAQLRGLADHWQERESTCGRRLNIQWTRRRFIDVASAWLRYLGHLHEPEEPIPFQSRMEEYCYWAKHERGLSATTIDRFRGCVAQFLRWYGKLGQPIESIRVNDVDAYLAYGHHHRDWCRLTVRNVANTLRAFCRYGAQQGWCDVNLANVIHGPRIYSQEGLPVGPSWNDVQNMFAALNPDKAKDVRDKAILMLLAIYGLRESEVAQLCLEDLDWEHDLLHVSRVKRRQAMTYPLLPSVGNAILDYLRAVRPASTSRQVFLGLISPHRPLSRGGMYGVVAPRLKALNLKLPHFGPHSLRHACATHLMAEGFSLTEIGDHLGHQSTAATRIYAKVDLAGLREVAAFDLGELS
jgi:site-specific recombinase XerD